MDFNNPADNNPLDLSILGGGNGEPENKPNLIVRPSTNLYDQTSESEVKQLTDSHPQFAVMVEGAERILDIQEIEDAIMKDDSISISEANVVTEAFPNFIRDTRIPLASFTICPSKTNLSMTKRYLKVNIAKESDSLRDLFKDCISGPIELAMCVAKKLSSEFTPGLLRAADSFHSVYDREQGLVLPNSVIPQVSSDDMRFTDILSYEPSVDDWGNLAPDGEDGSQYKQMAITIATALAQPSVRCFILSVLEGKVPTEPYLPAERSLSKQTKITTKMLLEFASSPQLHGHIESMGKLIEGLTSEIEERLPEANAELSKPDGLAKYVVTRSAYLSDYVSDITNYSVIYQQVYFLLVALKSLYEKIKD